MLALSYSPAQCPKLEAQKSFPSLYLLVSQSVPGSLASPSSWSFFSLYCTALIPVIVLSSALVPVLSPFSLPPGQPPPVHLLHHDQSSLSKATHLIILFPRMKPFSGTSTRAKSRLQSQHKALELGKPQ